MSVPADPSPANHPDPMMLLHAHVDGELDAADSMALEQSIGGSPSLRQEQARLLALKAVLQQHATKFVLPADSRRRLERQFSSRPSQRFDWRAMAASVAITAVLASAGTYVALTPSFGPEQQIANVGAVESIVAGHQRSLLAEQPVDVLSSDRHTVKPWLSNKLATSPPVVDLAAQGFTLIGGRVDIVSGQPAPTLVYRLRGHLISLTAVPLRPGHANPVTGPRNIAGYNIVTWQAGDFSYFAVSDIPPADLAAFSDTYRKEAL
jgi:anti-sigma factor RsiW